MCSHADPVTVEVRLFLSHSRPMQVLNFMRAGVVWINNPGLIETSLSASNLCCDDERYHCWDLCSEALFFSRWIKHFIYVPRRTLMTGIRIDCCFFFLPALKKGLLSCLNNTTIKKSLLLPQLQEAGIVLPDHIFCLKTPWRVRSKNCLLIHSISAFTDLPDMLMNNTSPLCKQNT